MDNNEWIQGLARTRTKTFGKIAALLGATELKTDTWEELEAILIQADLGVETTLKLTNSLQDMANNEGWTKAEQLKAGLAEELSKMISAPPPINYQPDGLTVIMVVGVNGSGKTTSAAKLGRFFKENGMHVSMAAADTFRAAAVEQLLSWGDRLGLRVITGQINADPGAVAYDSIQSALAKKEDILIIDTAGRLHTRYNLMEELKKIHRVCGKALPGAPHHIWLVMDATTGQNALHQAQAFKDAVAVDGIILAKLDSSARGGMAFAIQSQLALPIQFAGLGEQADDLKPFDPEAFISGVLADFTV